MNQPLKDPPQDNPGGANPSPLFPEKGPDETMEESPGNELLPTPPLSPGGFIRRGLAFLFDLTVIEWITILFVGIGFFAQEKALAASPLGAAEEQLVEWITLHSRAWSFVFISYFAFFTYYGGQTPGKMIFRLRVWSVEAGPVSLPRAFLRTLCYYLNFFTLGIGFLMAALTPSGRALHDYLSGTVVTKTRDS